MRYFLFAETYWLGGNEPMVKSLALQGGCALHSDFLSQLCSAAIKFRDKIHQLKMKMFKVQNKKNIQMYRKIIKVAFGRVIIPLTRKTRKNIQFQSAQEMEEANAESAEGG